MGKILSGLRRESGLIKKCCKQAKKSFGKERTYLKCSKCNHIYCDEYPKFTLECKCGKMPLIKCNIMRYHKNERQKRGFKTIRKK